MACTIKSFQLFSGFSEIHTAYIQNKLSQECPRRSIHSSTNSICGYASLLTPMHIEYLQK